MLNMKSFKKIDSGRIFAKGEIIDSDEGLCFDRSGKMLKWVAVKGHVNDWCVYAHLAENTFNFVRSYGNKVTTKENIQRVVPCEQDVFECYRY